jgi:nicotinamidase-related amidase
MGGTDLDAILRNLAVSNVVVGVSLNIAIPNFVMDAVNAAYASWSSGRGRRDTGRIRRCGHR